MNATTLPLPAVRFAAAPAPAFRIVAERLAERVPAATPAAAALTLEPCATQPTDALEAARACCPRAPYDSLARYAAPAAPALFHVC